MLSQRRVSIDSYTYASHKPKLETREDKEDDDDDLFQDASDTCQRIEYQNEYTSSSEESHSDFDEYKQDSLEPIADFKQTTNDNSIKHTKDDLKKLECLAINCFDISVPNFDYSGLVEELRHKFLLEASKEDNIGKYSREDIDNIKNDNWFVARYLFCNKLDINKAHEFMKASLRYKNESCISMIRDVDIPEVFYSIGAMFVYEKDRKGNVTLYLRAKLVRRLADISTIYHLYIYHSILKADAEARGKGIALVIDCTGAGIANADLDGLSVLLTILIKYYPEGLSYILVHEMPFYLRPICHLANSWVPNTYMVEVFLSTNSTIRHYIDDEALPDFMGGSCKRDYKQVPDNCTSIGQAAKLWGIKKSTVLKVLKKYKDDLPAGTMEKTTQELEELNL